MITAVSQPGDQAGATNIDGHGSQFFMVMQPTGEGSVYASCRSSASVECEDTLPIILHANHRPASRLCFCHERIGECADFGVCQTSGRAVRVLAFWIVVMHKHHEARAAARLC